MNAEDFAPPPSLPANALRYISFLDTGRLHSAKVIDAASFRGIRAPNRPLHVRVFKFDSV